MSAGTAPGDTRERILDAALRVIGEHGIAGLTNRRIAREAGVSLGSLTYHFTSQNELLSAGLLRFVGRETERIMALADDLSPDHPSLSEAAAVAERTLEAMAMGAESIGVLELYLHAARDPELHAAAQRCWEAYDHVAEAVLTGLGVPDPAALAPQVVALIAGIQLRWLATGTPPAGGLAAGLATIVIGAARTASRK